MSPSSWKPKRAKSKRRSARRSRSPRSQPRRRAPPPAPRRKETSSVGQKTHPYGFRLGYNRTWHSRWYAGNDYSKLLHDDLKLRKQLKEQLKHAGVSESDRERPSERLRVPISPRRRSIIMARKGAEVDRLRDDLMKAMGRPVHINI